MSTSQDLHSDVVLDFPEGTCDQIHKCIAAASTSRGVFDGSVRVNQKAQVLKENSRASVMLMS